MDNNSDDQLLIMQYTIEATRKEYYEKMKNLTEHLSGMIASVMDHNKISKP